MIVAIVATGNPAPATTIIGATPQQTAYTHQVLTNYETAGFDLPAVIIDFTCPHPRDSLRGSYDGERICLWDIEALGHELAHVWDKAHLTETTKAAFTARLGATSWAGADLAWYQKPAEKAADVIAWGVDPDRKHNAVYAEFYEILTAGLT